MSTRNQQRRHILIASGLVSLAALLVVVFVAVMATRQPERTEPVAAEILREPEPTWPVQTSTPEAVQPGDGTFVDWGTVDRGDPDAVAEAVAVISASHDTVTDRTETAALTRAGALLDVPAVEEPERNAAGASWLVAAEHEAYTVPVARPSALPPQLEHDHDEELMLGGERIRPYMFEVTYSWQGRDGWVSDPGGTEVRSVLLSLAERDGRWVVVEHYYGEPLTSEYAR